MAVLVTGVAGFIGAATARALLEHGDEVVGIDNLNDYYDPRLKQARLTKLQQQFGNRFRFERIDFADAAALKTFTDTFDIDGIVHLGAQAGVRYSLENPQAYVHSNLVGHVNMLELARARGPRHMVYASSSSVYGGNQSLPFRVEDRVDHPLSLYAATKKADELLSESYANIYRLPLTGLRFFTVYGPWGRPDMALFKFTKGILEGTPIDVYNHGVMFRDFTYVEDLVRGIRLLIDTPPERPATRDLIAPGDSLSPVAPFRVVNMGNSDMVRLEDFIDAIEQELGKKAIRNYMDMQPGDVPATWADASLLKSLTGYAPGTDIRDGVKRFVAWYREYFGV